MIKKEYIDFQTALEPVTHAKMASALPENGLDSKLEAMEKKIILCALELAKWNKTEAAKLLKLSPPSLYYRLEKHGLN
jgi:DNA-binding NtrC family response regulator